MDPWWFPLCHIDKFSAAGYKPLLPDRYPIAIASSVNTVSCTINLLEHLNLTKEVRLIWMEHCGVRFIVAIIDSLG